MHRPYFALALMLAILPACADESGDGGAAAACETDADCDAGSCVAGRCVTAGADATTLTDAAVGPDDTGLGNDTLPDVVVDVGPTSDGWPTDEGAPDAGAPDAAPDASPGDATDAADAGPPDVADQPDVPEISPDCGVDADCPGLQRCDLLLEPPACVEPPICLSDEDCVDGRVCDRGGCADTWSGCATDEDCPTGACEPGGHICTDVLPCTGDGDCAAGRLCVDEACVECVTPADCPSLAMKCVGNLCYEPIACGKDDECLEGAVCLGGSCTQPIFPDDPFEPNDGASAAQPLPNGAWSDLTIQEWDDDWFVVDVPAGHGLLARVRSVGDGDLDLTLLDATGAHVLSEATGAGDWAVVGTAPRPSAQVYLLHVTNPVGAVSAYELITSLPTKPLCVPDPMDAEAPNDAPETSVPITGAELVTHGTTICAGETDWYRVETFGSATITAALAFPKALGDLDVRIYDGDEELASASAPGGDLEVASVANIPAGIWYVEVRGATELDHNGYELTVKVISSAACQVDDLEINDSPASAAPFVGSNQQLTLCPGDEDWFASSVPAGKGLVATISYANFSSQLAVDVVDSDGVTVLASDPGSTFPKGVKTQSAALEGATKTKTVYTRVHRVEPANPEQFTPYSVQIALVAGFCADDASEPDSSWDLAHALPTLPGQTVLGKVCPGDPGDWFQVDLDGNSVLSVDLVHPVDVTPLELSLFRPDGTTVEPVVATYFNDKGKVLVFDASKSTGASGTWFVRVSSAAGAQATDYTITAAVADKGACPLDDLWEPNDTPFSSKPLAVGSTISPFLCANNPDFFQIQATPTTPLVLTVTPPPTAPKVVAQLWSPTLELVFSETIVAAKQISLTGKITSPGMWFLSFRGPLPGTYAIKLESSP